MRRVEYNALGPATGANVHMEERGHHVCLYSVNISTVIYIHVGYLHRVNKQRHTRRYLLKYRANG